MKRLDRIEKNKNGLVHSRTEHEREPRSLNPLFIFIIIIFLGGAVYLLFFSNLLNIEKYEISGYSHQETIQTLAKEESQKTLLGDNILFFRVGQLKRIISGDPTVESVNVRKKYPRIIVIEIKETVPAIVWISAGEKHLISDRGDVMGEQTNEILPVVYDAANIKVSSGDRVASPTFINFIKVISDKFEPATGTSISRINIFDILSDVHIISSAGWTVYFNSSRDPDSQLANLTRVLPETKRVGTKKLEYIDMRIDTKIFYK